MSKCIKFYFASSMLNKFRTLIHPSSGACDFSIVSPHWFAFLFRCVLEFRCGLVGVVSVWQASVFRLSGMQEHMLLRTRQSST